MTLRLSRRESLRLKDYDYSKSGAYFVTICVRKHECLLGSVVDGEMRLNDYGNIAAEGWQWLAGTYPQLDLDEWRIMPNHLHGIIILKTESQSPPRHVIKSKPLGRLMGAFKTVSTKKINLLRQMEGLPFWQRSFYEHVIRNEGSLNRISEYIRTNPQRWELDRENPWSVGKDDFDLWLNGVHAKPKT